MALTKVNRGGLNTGVSDSSDATAITIDSSEQVGIGETSPTSALHVKGGAGANIAVQSTAGSHWRIGDGVGTSNSNLAIYDYTNSALRINISDGGVTQVNANSAAYALQVTNDGDNTNRYGIQITCGADNGSGTNYLMGFRDGDGGSVGSITYSSTTTSFNTSSDYRLKSNIADLTDATTKLKELKPKKFSWTKDTTNTLLHGFLAHEVSSVVPEAVIGEKDAKDADGKPEYQQIDHSKLIPLLVKTIQELEARIATLEAK